MEIRQIKDIIEKILIEVSIFDYDPVVVTSLSDFIYNYVTSLLKEAKNIAQGSDLTLQHILFAINYINEQTVIISFDEIATFAHTVNKQALPEFTLRYGLNLPLEYYSLNKCNYALRRMK